MYVVRDEELWQESFISMPEVDINGWLDNGTAGNSLKNGYIEGSIFCKELEGLQMDIDLSDSTPLQWNYVSYYPKTPLSRNEELHQGPNEQTVHHQIAVILFITTSVHYRALNRRTVPDRHPIPQVQEMLDSLGGNSWFSMLDQGKAYHQGFIAPKSWTYTAFITPGVCTSGYAYPLD